MTSAASATICLDHTSPCDSFLSLLWPRTRARSSHPRKYLAVSPELNRFVSVRNSKVTLDRRYLLRSQWVSLLDYPDFPLSLIRRRAVARLPGASHKNRTCVPRFSDACSTIELGRLVRHPRIELGLHPWQGRVLPTYAYRWYPQKDSNPRLTR